MRISKTPSENRGMVTYKKMPPYPRDKGSATMRRCGLVGGGVVLSGEAVTVVAGSEVSFARAFLSVTLRPFPVAF